VKFFVWDDPYLFKYCLAQVSGRRIPDNEIRGVLSFCHDQTCEGNFSGRKPAVKVLQCGFYWPPLFRDTFEYYTSCPRFQLLDEISWRDMMPLSSIIVVEIFDVLGMIL